MPLASPARRAAMLTALLAAVLLPSIARVARAQDATRPRGGTAWWLPASVTGGLVGAAAGIALTAPGDPHLESDATILVPLVGFVVGAVGGGIVGHRADVALGRGDSLSARHRAVLHATTVATGAGVGAVAAALLIDQPAFTAPDGAVYAGLAVGGALLGYAADRLVVGRSLDRNRARVAIAPARGGGVRLAVRATF